MKAIEAQIFAPSAGYHQPTIVREKAVSTWNYTIGALFTTPATKAIILKRLPSAAFLGSISGKAVYTTCTIRDLAETLSAILPPATLDLIDQDLALLPQSEWPSDDQ